MGLVMPELDSCLNLGQEQVLNTELGRHRGKDGMTECMLYDDECENVHVLWDCPAYKDSRE